MILGSFRHFKKKSKLDYEKEKFVKNECFELLFEMAVSNGQRTDSVQDRECDLPVVGVSPSDTKTSSVLEDYKRLYKNKIYADVDLLVNNQSIPAHKSILAIRSPVFLAMFDANMVEKETGSVSIPDLDVETVNSLLQYMYTGEVETLDYEIAAKLIVAADKYQVLPLKEKCANFLKGLLSYENVCDILVVADLVQHEVLKAAVVEYIGSNCEHIFLLEEWNHFVETNLLLATETVQKVSQQIGTDRFKRSSVQSFFDFS